MQSVFKSVLALTACAAMAAAVSAQAPAPPPPPEGPRYVVTYVEVKPTAADRGRKAGAAVPRRHPQGGRQSARGVLCGASARCIISCCWRRGRTRRPSTRTSRRPRRPQFRDKIKAIQNAPIDDRVHFPLSVGPLEVKAAGAAVAVVTHVDVIPPQRENGTAITKQLAEDSRKEAGNLRFEAVTQVNRQNHFTVIEVWRDRKTVDVHSMAAHTRAFRDKLAPATGALYDERFYRFMN